MAEIAVGSGVAVALVGGNVAEAFAVGKTRGRGVAVGMGLSRTASKVANRTGTSVA